MLTEKRQEEILKLLEGNGSVTVQELTDKFGASESTIRRDLNTLHNRGVLVKVFGGAIKNEMKMQVKEEEVARRIEYNKAEKERIAKFAASLIVPGDFVYLDAGTTTGAMIPLISMELITFSTPQSHTPSVKSCAAYPSLPLLSVAVQPAAEHSCQWWVSFTDHSADQLCLCAPHSQSPLPKLCSA